MKIEVEQKHRVTDLAAFERLLAERGVAMGEPQEQSDRYFAHPCRDFAKTDEALRIRTVGDASFVTYKGPKLDKTTKTRRELELPLSETDPAGDQFAELLSALGFTPVATVRKTRRAFYIEHDGQEVHGAMDDVAGVGTFVELELASDDANFEAAKGIVAAVAAGLKLGPQERRSYLEMLLDGGGS
jgi:adenylate cyclase class 2